jgi:hypothetical protein
MMQSGSAPVAVPSGCHGAFCRRIEQFGMVTRNEGAITGAGSVSICRVTSPTHVSRFAGRMLV